MKRYALIAFAASLVMAGTLHAGTIDVSVRIEPAMQLVPLGSNFTVDIVADLLSPVVGWGLDLDLDNPGVISPSASIVMGPNWIQPNSGDGDGLVGLAWPFAPIFGSISGNSVVLATLTYHADAIGSTQLLLSSTEGDLTEGFPLDPFGFAQTEYLSGVVIVTPEPVAFLLMFLPIALRRRR